MYLKVDRRPTSQGQKNLKKSPRILAPTHAQQYFVAILDEIELMIGFSDTAENSFLQFGKVSQIRFSRWIGQGR
jgi:hypothetical protein